MEKRKAINDKIVAWLKNRAKTEYVDDVSLVAIYGSHINGTANYKSDVDCYFIPKTPRGELFKADFILAGVGYDIFPITWERLEGIAELNEFLTPLVGDAEIIYCSGVEAEERFHKLQSKLKANLMDDAHIQRTERARCKMAGEFCSAMRGSQNACEIRKLAGCIIMTLADAVAIHHHNYFHFGLKRQYENLCHDFPDVPKSIAAGYRNVVISDHVEAAADCALNMFEDVCKYLGLPATLPEESPMASGAERSLDGTELAALYEEISSTFNKIYVSCENGDDILAFLSAVCLQLELDEIDTSFDLLSNFNYLHLDRLAKTTQNAEDRLVHLIEERGGKIKVFDSFEEFELARL